MKKTIKLKVRRLGSLIKGLQALDELRIPDNKLSIQVAQNILVVQDVIDGWVSQEEKIKQDVIAGHQTPIVTEREQVKLNPDAEIRAKMVALGNSDQELELYLISAPKLFSGEVKPVPGMLASIMPLLEDLDQVETLEE